MVDFEKYKPYQIIVCHKTIILTLVIIRTKLLQKKKTRKTRETNSPVKRMHKGQKIGYKRPLEAKFLPKNPFVPVRK